MIQNPWNDPAFAAAWNDTYGLSMDKAVSRAGLIYPWVEEQIGDFTGKEFADFGCGNGNLIHHFRDRAFASWQGYDSGRAILETARHIDDPRVRLDAIDLAGGKLLGLKRVDALTAIFVIEEIPDAKLIDFFRNTAGALKTDGRALFVTNHPVYAMLAPDDKFENHRGYFDTHVTTYNLELLNRQGGHATRVAYHHKPLSTIFNALGTVGLKVDTVQEVPSGVTTMDQWRTHTPARIDVPRFLMMTASLR